MAFIEPSFNHEAAHSPVIPAMSASELSAMETALLQTVAYSDIFDYPLTAAEIHRYLIDIPAARDEVERLLSDGRLVPHYLSHRDGYFTLPGRETIIETRRRRERQAARLWKRAVLYGRIIASLPFVRMVAVTGELAMDNVGPSSDIDYFVVTEPGRLWLARLMIVGVVRSAAPRGDVICPNYLLTENALEFDDRNLYTAHEVAQMVPISGFATYRRLRELNTWIEEYLPNTGGPPRYVRAPSRGRPARALVEAALRTGVGDRLERWEMRRKVRKLAGDDAHHPETAFSPDRCKGHVDGHGERVLAMFAERWQSVKVLMQ